MLQIIQTTTSATSIHMIYINFILLQVIHGNDPLKIQMELSSFVIHRNSHVQMPVHTAPRQNKIQPSAYSRNIRPLEVSQIVTLKRDIRKEISYSIRT
jgi:hypothetical protein